LSPWWLRPTSEGAADEDKPDQQEQDRAPQEARGEQALHHPTQKPHDAAPEETEGGQAAAAPETPPAPARTPEEPGPAFPEPYRPFWHREESETPPAEAGRPGAPGAPVTPATPWGAQPGLDFDRPASSLAPVSIEPADADLEAEGEGEGEAEERDEEGAGRPEVRKRRSRRGRGGRRKNGRAAADAGAGAGAAEPAEDDDEELGPEEPPRPFGPQLAAPAPVTLTPRAARAGESYVISANDLDSMSREIIISVPDRQRPQHEERKIAVFCDFENIALGVRDSEISKLDIGLILERLLEKGKIIVKKAYADWERYSDYKRPFHEAAIELIDIPQKFYSGKNSADIKMVVDAMDLSYSKEHLDTFVILSGDSDFSPLVSKLKENNKYVIGIGVKNSSSNLLVDNCDEFIYYEDIWRDAQKGPKLDGLGKKTAEAFSLMVESIQALVRENKDVLWGSMIKQTMQRKKPSFNEGYYGYSTFSELLEDAERKNIVKLKKDQRSGTYIVTGFAKSSDAGPGRRQV
jgi:uncharacterized protein (TIGR00288 family)